MSLRVYGSLIGLEVEKTKLCTQRRVRTVLIHSGVFMSLLMTSSLEVSFVLLVTWLLEVAFAALPSVSVI